MLRKWRSVSDGVVDDLPVDRRIERRRHLTVLAGPVPFDLEVRTGLHVVPTGRQLQRLRSAVLHRRVAVVAALAAKAHDQTAIEQFEACVMSAERAVAEPDGRSSGIVIVQLKVVTSILDVLGTDADLELDALRFDDHDLRPNTIASSSASPA